MARPKPSWKCSRPSAAARNTLSVYRADLEDFSASGAGAAQASAAELSAYVESLHAGGRSARTAARRVSALRQFFLFLLREGIRADNPAGELATPRLPQSLPKTSARRRWTGP